MVLCLGCQLGRQADTPTVFITAGDEAWDTDRLQEIYRIIDEQEKTEIKVKEFFHFKELYPFFLIPALLLLAADIIIRTTLLRTIP